MMSKEAMKLALEALEKLVRFESDSWEIGACRIVGQASRALREALAEQPAQQEPVAAQSVMTVRIWRDKNSDQNAEFKNWHKLPDGEHILYTSPPAQRTWVGLSEEEREQHRDDWHSNIHDKEFRAIETKLKEKNT
jgi:hypothetical protein